jgi:NADPH-dependent curcumin reductase CurA
VKEACPKGVDVFFDNTGGRLLYGKNFGKQIVRVS